ncbi:MAG: aldehyde dehydrogenase family protein [Phycisphaerales bacterium JB050]
MAIAQEHPGEFILAGDSVRTSRTLTVTDKFTGDPIAEVPLAGPSEIERAIALGKQAEFACASIPLGRRAEILDTMAGIVLKRKEEIARSLALEAGKPIQAATVETNRCIATLRESARVAREEFTGAGHHADRNIRVTPKSESPAIHGILRRLPIGLCSLITPFNFPLNLVAHKIGPAIACGCPFVLKPASKTPLSGLILGSIALEAGWHPAGISVLPCNSSDAGPLSTDERFRLLSFTGSDEVGWKLKASAAKMRVALELGGDAAVIISDSTDQQTRQDAAKRIASAAYGYAGQSCISVQRIVVIGEAYEPMRDLILKEIKQLKAGDPMNPDTFIGPLIDRDAADRVESWISEAVEGGATKLIGGDREGNTIMPTLLEQIPGSCKLAQNEVFGPVAYLIRAENFDEAINITNRSRYGLQAGIYSGDEQEINRAFSHLEVGAVIAGDVPTFRTDPMPYGGVKDSGIGREGPLYTAEDMTEPRLLVRRDTEGSS